MKKELDYFYIDKAFGGNQDWFHDPMMKLGGCAAATACDLSIYLTLYRGKQGIVPFDIKELTRKNYINFSKIMKPYLRPRREGVNRLELYTEGFGKYLSDCGGASLEMDGFAGTRPISEAVAAIKSSIDAGLPVPYLMLRHKDPMLKDYVWHWFLLVGYEKFEDTFMVKTATYGEYQWLDFANLWNTGYAEKGGFVLVRD